MALWCGIDLHSNNCVTAIIDADGKRVHRQKLGNDLEVMLRVLEPYRAALEGIVVESTYNWYWLVDGLMDAGYRLHLANPAAIQQYSGIKYTDDRSDAVWLAEMLRLGILPEGYIYPKEWRAVRDLARKRMQLVQQRTSNVLSIQNQVVRSTATRLSARTIKGLEEQQLKKLGVETEVGLAIGSNMRVMQCLSGEIERLEETILRRVKLRSEFDLLHTIPGVGDILGLTIMLEVGEIGRFPTVGDFASYCRCVDSRKLSNGKKKGAGNVKNGNGYLAWAWVEAANFALRSSCKAIQRFYQRKESQGGRVLAIKATAHKLARGGYHVMREQVPFELAKAFS